MSFTDNPRRVAIISIFCEALQLRGRTMNCPKFTLMVAYLFQILEYIGVEIYNQIEYI